MPSFKTLAAASLFSLAFVQATTVSSPASLTTCVPVQLNWSEGTAPFFLSILPGGEPSGTPLRNFGQQTANTYTWNVDLAAGTSVTIAVTDSTGVPAYSSEVTIQAGTSTSCVTAAGGAGSGASSSPAASDSVSSSAPSSESSSVRNNASSKAASISSAATSGAASISSKVSSAVSAASSAVNTASTSDAKAVAKYSVLTVASGLLAFALL